MKIVGVMLARQSDWVIGLSARAALKWVDALFVVMHECTDLTWPILRKIQEEVGRDRLVAIGKRGATWDEMTVRQLTLQAAREMGATHVAIIDDDEVPTANVIENLRGWCETLGPGQLLELPMIAPWKGMEAYRDDASVWSSAFITLAFKDAPHLGWKSADDGYAHHNRPPHGAFLGMADRFRPLRSKDSGGILHLQWVNWRRTIAKSAWYKVLEASRWPGRNTADQLNAKYDEMVTETDIRTAPMKAEWIHAYRLPNLLGYMMTEGKPWQEDELKRIFKLGTPGMFDGLKLHGLVQ